MPSNTLVLGRYPKSFSKAWTSAKVSGTSPGWSGNNFFLAFFPEEVSIAFINSFNSTGALLPIL